MQGKREKSPSSSFSSPGAKLFTLEKGGGRKRSGLVCLLLLGLRVSDGFFGGGRFEKNGNLMGQACLKMRKNKPPVLAVVI